MEREEPPGARLESQAPSVGRSVWGLRLAGSFLLAGLAALSAHLYREDAEERARLELLARRFTLDQRHPGSVRTIAVAPSADLALSALVTATLDDALSPRALRGLSPSARRAWLDAATRLDEQMSEMEKRLARAAVGRPGWPYHRILRGQLAFLKARRRGEPGSPDAWWPPLHLGSSAAPGDDGPAVFLSAAALDSWDELSESRRREAKEVLRRAFRDAGFLNVAVALVERRIGREETLALLPDTAAALKAAYRAAAAAADLALAADLHRRWEARERVERERDLRALEERSRRGDVAGARRLCASFLAAHPASDLDDSESRRQLARVLALWPGGHGGSFSSDPRALLVRHLLDGRAEGVDGQAMARALDDLPDAPDSVRATAWVLAGNAYELERLARKNEASETLEWAPVWLLAVRRRLALGDLDGAAEAMARVARPALSACDGLLARRDLAKALGDADESASLTAELRALDVKSVPGGGQDIRLTLCVDPEAHERVLRLTLAGGPALVAWGFDGARSALSAIGAQAELLVPLAGFRGRRILRLQAEAGGPVQVVEAIRSEP